jgi:hypothetical protein
VASNPAVEWPSGEATACKAVHTGSIPVSTSNSFTRARLAQRESASLTRKRSLVQSQYRAPQPFLFSGVIVADERVAGPRWDLTHGKPERYAMPTRLRWPRRINGPAGPGRPLVIPGVTSCLTNYLKKLSRRAQGRECLDTRPGLCVQ